MFRLLPPAPLGGPEQEFPARRVSPWVVVVLVVVGGGWTPERAAMILAVLTTVTMLALILRWNPRRA
jgi:hypothetical protein